MKVKLIKYVASQGLASNTYQLSLNSVYEVISILFLQNSHQSNEIKIYYYLVCNDSSIGSYSSSYFEIIDSTIDADFIYEYDERINAFILHPKIINKDKFWNSYRYSEDLQVSTKTYERFKHLFSEQQLAEFFKEQYQNPSITIAAEAIGDNWVICPECNQAFSVDPNIGELVCPNIACKTKLNNPYAKKFPVEA